MFSMTPWYAIPLGWAPAIIYYYSLSDVSLVANLFCLFLGVFFWTFCEYTLHRFVFHGEDYWLPNNPKFLAAHFLIHGIHHDFPMDAFRLVFPVIPGYVIFFGFLMPPLSLIVPDIYINSVTAGSALGYVLYDLIHYFLHHS
jgi:4-hydroxysphinganine ceramide fatty acyl 2-hydroxylase